MFMSNNGCQWARKNSKLTNNYNFKRFNAKEMGMTGISWNKIVAVQAQGFKEKKENHQIPKDIYTQLKDKKLHLIKNFLNNYYKTYLFDF